MKKKIKIQRYPWNIYYTFASYIDKKKSAQKVVQKSSTKQATYL